MRKHSATIPRGRAVRNLCHNRVLKHLFFTSGVHSWEVHVARMGASAAVVVGAVATERFDGETLNGPLSSWTGGAIGYTAYGAIIRNGMEVALVEPFHEGDCVGVQVDLNARTIAFFLNGREITTRSCGDYNAACLALPVVAHTAQPSLPPLTFTAPALFAAVTLTPTTDEVDIYSTPTPFSQLALPTAHPPRERLLAW